MFARFENYRMHAIYFVSSVMLLIFTVIYKYIYISKHFKQSGNLYFVLIISILFFIVVKFILLLKLYINLYYCKYTPCLQIIVKHNKGKYFNIFLNFMLWFFLLQYVSINYDFYYNVEGVEIGIPSIYWLRAIRFEGDYFLYINLINLGINITLLIMFYCLFHSHRNFIRIFVFIILIFSLSVLRPFLGRNTGYLCDCYGFPVGYIMECGHYSNNSITVAPLLIIFTVEYLLMLVMFVYIANLMKKNYFFYIALTSLIYYLIFGITHQCEDLMLGYLGYQNPGFTYSLHNLIISADFGIILSEYISTAIAVFIYTTFSRSEIVK